MLEQFRDVMIIIMAFMAIGAAVLFATLTIVIFRKVSHTVDSVQGIVSDLRVLSSVVRPTIKVASFAAGARKALSSLSKRAQKKEAKSGKAE